ncbi:hypothetical protein [Campylobacter coli]|uniref:hypothetical protein n=1 Tax=Campylobacter coli TaxID=195 RepID=UPI001274EBEB|nr:hypothetical protein [Campylobacter coli]EAM0196198.1 hypothetical protein [Campylobacter coli]EAM0354752.1 hypothetical protein [Campylobacter coli]MCH3753576.1 hypothetical protein [Campylobacter coli]MCL4567196.1 hypothetical protein [Campylobacter coli]MDC8034436.1 hypothetical protein [Campylobacter coli]
MIGTDLYNAKDENGIFYIRELYQRALDKGRVCYLSLYKTSTQWRKYNCRKNSI